MIEPDAFDTILSQLVESGLIVDEDRTRVAREESPNTVAIFLDPDGELNYIQWDGGDGTFDIYGYDENYLLAELYSEDEALHYFEWKIPPLTVEDLAPLRHVLREGVKHYDSGDVRRVHEVKMEARKQRCEQARTVTLSLPSEFLDLCEECTVDPTRVLRSFVADLCHLEDGEYITSGSDERDYARAYFERCGYRFMAELRKEKK